MAQTFDSTLQQTASKRGLLAAARSSKARLLPAASCRMQVDGVSLHWTERGTGTPLVVLHGLADSQHTWGAVTVELATKYRVLGLDLPGCGLSGRPDAAYRLDWQARLIDRWLGRLGLDALDVLGHSYGGGVALWLLLYRARSIRKMALIAPGGLGVEVSPLLRLGALFGHETVAEYLLGPMTRLFLYCQGTSLSPAERRRLWQMNSMPGSARALARTIRDVIDWRGQTRHILHRIDQVQQLPAIGLFWGERDDVIPVDHGKALCSMLDNCSLWQLPGAGHFLHWQAPKLLASAVLSFLDRPDLQPSLLRKGQAIDCRPSPSDRRGSAAARTSRGNRDG
jgi:pimeloyl-ACP methyl ester carboxylesterase